MKRCVWMVVLTVFLVLLGTSMSQPAGWNEVEDAVRRGLPRTAIAALEPIIERALAERAYAEAARAMARRITLEAEVEGNRPEERITRMEQAIETAPAEMQPLFRALLGHWYWQYFQENRWRFMQRTATAEAPGADFTTWDLPRLFAEIDRQFAGALSAEEFLKATPVAEFDALLMRGTMPDALRPTLYDFVVYEALKFYASGEQAGARPQDDFEILAATPIFATAEEFLEWQLPENVAGTAKGKAILLFQDLLRFHRNDGDPSAFADADLERLVFGHNMAVGEGKEARFLSALERFVERHGGREVAARALHRWALVLQGQDDYVAARTVALRGVEEYRDTPGGRLCASLVLEIEAREASIQTERVWNAPWPKTHVTYRNVGHVYFRAVPFVWENHADRWNEQISDDQRNALLNAAPAAAWESALPATTDFKQRREAVDATSELKPGYYYIISSHNAEFAQADNQISFVPVWVSDLALVTRPRADRIEGLLVRALTGEPVTGGEIELFLQDYRTRTPERRETRTDENGFFSFAAPAQYRPFVIRARHEGDQMVSVQGAVSRSGGRGQAGPRAVLFTDRAIYRPGQTVNYKGILVQTDQRANNYSVIERRRVIVSFRDANGEEIERQERQSNDYGSISGSFTAPRGRVTGLASIQIENIPGAVQVRVEEYKRPRFLVTLEPPAEAPKLGQGVLISGKAASYAGAAIDSAEVRYRVVREVRMPWWWGWRRGGPAQSASQEIADGTVRTGVDGAFHVEFVAQPDLSIPEEDEPAFVFRVYATVTDNAGETRAAERTLTAGYTALEAVMSTDSWLTMQAPVPVRISTRSLDGEPQPAQGTVRIHKLREPERVQRPRTAGGHHWRGPQPGEEDDLSDPNFWPLAESVVEQEFATAADGVTTLTFKLDPGVYRAVIETQDRFGKKITGLLPMHVLDPAAGDFSVPQANFFAVKETSLQPGEKLVAVWGTGYPEGRALVEIEHRNQIIQSYWTGANRTQTLIETDVTEEMRGGFTVHVSYIRENRAYLTSRKIEVPWKNKELAVRWETLRSKLEPAQEETWTAVITGPDAEGAVAEMVASLYDASLEAFVKHHWLARFGVFYQDYSSARPQFANQDVHFQTRWNRWQRSHSAVEITYRSFPRELLWENRMVRTRMMSLGGAAPPRSPARQEMAMDTVGGVVAESAVLYSMAPGGGESEELEPGPDLSQVAARRNLQETAFFFPHLVSETNGVVRMTFKMPEALTEWRFIGFAHDARLRSGYLEGTTVTQKDLMVQPNAPRFVREGDVIEFMVTISNQSDEPQRGQVRLALTDAMTETPADALVQNHTPEQPFDIPARESRSYSWRLSIPDGLAILSYRAVAASSKVSDGEEGYLPVVSRRILVRESLPLPIRGPGQKEFTFEKLRQSGGSATLAHQSLTVQMVSNPSWYAVLALPYLMEFPHECSEQVFNRFYANALARHIGNSDPRIRRVFDLWKNTEALDSPLEKNEELKSIVLQETPWVRQAHSESQARRNVGILFDENRLQFETGNTLEKLAEMQHHDGAWPWFPGGPPNDYITLYIVTGFGRMRHLGLDIPMDSPIAALARLDDWIDRQYRDIKQPDRNHLTPVIALYLYGRSFYLEDKPIEARHREAVDYYLGQARKFWVELQHRQSQAHLALALKRFGDAEVPGAIVNSLRERAVETEEMGMFWRDLEFSWWWYRAPIETQALMIEAFDEIANDADAVEACKVWLLKQKQTQDWKTTKATADAVYALLLRGENLLASTELVEVTVGEGASERRITPERSAMPDPGTAAPGLAVEPGTGFFEVRFAGGDVKPEYGQISVRKADAGVAWGGIHWQYLEDISNVTPHEATPLTLRKRVFTKQQTPRGPVLEAVAGPVAVGDELVVRIELRVDRDMEYVHLKDQRGSGLEPLNVLSQYRYQDGLAYYESTRDTASHFFIDYLPRGVYVFEYSTRVFHRGEYQTGIAEIQCMYAPEFNSHSESIPLAAR